MSGDLMGYSDIFHIHQILLVLLQRPRKAPTPGMARFADFGGNYHPGTAISQCSIHSNR